MPLVLALVLAACVGGDGDEVDEGIGTPEEIGTVEGGLEPFEPKPAIVLVVNDWTASAINVAVAEQLIERQLGYPVLATRLDDTTEIYDGLADGSLDAVLEIWPSRMNERDQRYFERGQVVELGPLGSVGKVGWYVPRYLVEARPELATWEGYGTAEAGQLFATADSGGLGQFLGTNPDYAQYDQEIIDNLGLPFEVVFSGSEQATTAQIAASTQAGEPLLLYWWTPTSAVALYDLVNVALPAPTEACAEAAATGSGGVACDYPEDILFKVGSPQLAEKAPDVEAFLRQFTLSTEDQLEMLVAVEGNGLTISSAAANWIAANEETWQAWLQG